MCLPGCEDPPILLVDVDMGGALRVYEFNGEKRTDAHPTQRLAYCVAHGAPLGLKDRITEAVAVPAGSEGSMSFPDPAHVLAENFGWMIRHG